MQGNCSRLRGSDRLSTGIAYLATALGTAKKPADLINSEQLLCKVLAYNLSGVAREVRMRGVRPDFPSEADRLEQTVVVIYR